mgnify:FL=1
MRKKFIILIALLVSSILANSMVCYCSNKDLEEYFDIEKYNYMCNELLNVGVIDNINDSRTYVSREDCIKSVLRTIGVNDEIAQKYTYLKDENGGFCDINYCTDISKGYINFAKINGLAFGTYDKTNDCTFFYPKKAVSLNDCLTFMLRCLDNSEKISDVLSGATENGIIKSNDYFLDYYFLNYQGYYNLLFRMLNSKIYCFVKTSSDMKTVFIEKDKDRNITYFEYLKNNNL